jgi:hypothetical protein
MDWDHLTLTFLFPFIYFLFMGWYETESLGTAATNGPIMSASCDR